MLQHLANTIIIFVAGACHNIGFLIQGKAQLRHAHGSTNGVVILVMVAHNKNSIRLLHLLVNGLRHNARPHTGALGNHSGGAAKELRILIL